MPRDGSNVYGLPAGSTATAGTTIESAKYNAVLADLAADANLPRPIVAGGTGVSTAGAWLSQMGVTATAAEINLLDGLSASLSGLTATAAELNILDGATLSTAELNILDGATISAAELNILDGATLSTAELNILDGVTATAAEINTAANFGLIAQGTLTGAELAVEIPTDIETVCVEVWNFLPTTSAETLQFQVGSGTIGSPTWVATYVVLTSGAAAAVYGATDTTPTSIPLTAALSNTGVTSNAVCQLTPFNQAGILPAGVGFRTGRNQAGNNYITSLGIRATGTASAMTLIRLFVAAGNMAGSYRIVGYRKP